MHAETPRRIALAAAVAAIVGAIAWIETQGTDSSVPAAPTDLPGSEAGLPGAANFEGATGWLNTPNGTAIDLVSLRGKVVLVDFWTYSCINCIHTLPHITRLHDTYGPYGFTVVGVHTPEFGFERRPENVARAIAQHGIHYPVPQDNDYSIWDAYHNQYWPRHYLVDQYGKIRADHIGEGGYEETERQVRALLEEAGHTGLPPAFEGGDTFRGGARTPELYAAHGRSAIGNPEGYRKDTQVEYARPTEVSPDRIYLVGSWFDGAEEVTAKGDGAILLSFQAGGANVVLDGATGCLPITLDGRPVPADLAGADVEGARSCLRVDGADSYDFYAGPPGRHVVELQAPPGLRLYTFAFSAGAT